MQNLLVKRSLSCSFSLLHYAVVPYSNKMPQSLILLPTSLSLFLIITVFFFYSPTFTYAQNHPQYQNCSELFQCGNISGIGYPFWGSGRAEYCGHPNFELICNAQTATIALADELTYQVLEIGSETKNLLVVRTDYIDDICPSRLANTTLNTTNFSFGPEIQNIDVYYGCSSSTVPLPMKITGFSNEFSCNRSANGGKGYYTTRDLGDQGNAVTSYLGTCEAKVIIPATRSAVEGLEKSNNLNAENLVIALGQGFGLVYKGDHDSTCGTCELSGGKCGSNLTDSNLFSCYCTDRPYPFSCGGSSGSSSGEDSNISLKAGIGIGSSVAAVILLFIIYYCFAKLRSPMNDKAIKSRRTNSKEDEKIEEFILSYQSLMPMRFSYSDIYKMTNSFIQKLGQGGFGDVYKGKLPDGRIVAVKVPNKSTGDGEEFINEVAAIGRTSHVNIVTLLGFCYEGSRRALIYEYMPNGSLDKFINSQGSKLLEWKTLYDIAVGAARGLEYLHRGCNTRIVHFDIKPHNILLDEDFCPKISDFGLAKLCKGKESKISLFGARGTPGYIAPEVFMRSFGGVSNKSDVYSYGMMILDMFEGRNNRDNGTCQNGETYFPDLIYEYLESRNISSVHENITNDEDEIVQKVTIVGLWCIQTIPSERPSMTKVVEMLESNLQSLQIPPKPSLFSTAIPKFSSEISSPYSCSHNDEEKVLSLAEVELVSIKL
ncbi:LEAF RUST 10 DISEASE-RESISTANCE LOCUS RECEPTOR-LIKE PROTEIN KINASE-like 2.1 [Mercurialis annua]|uniref:LEAF RUST 10 DISEASE-RESISTANCE LOCUS RECEPTOR-LIKE PROTEIN KINASE-like 2.1 n=1 Tax=Mercurialis annua TaxID=3986 RepID=UPI00215ECCA6|nr:LEAF RUST 10 DISEASE-RESISTANCE LOCUS RECEPTOR-LIKE PROTEIN KINASE-like 2.1 [Mercurialis annua]